MLRCRHKLAGEPQPAASMGGRIKGCSILFFHSCLFPHGLKISERKIDINDYLIRNVNKKSYIITKDYKKKEKQTTLVKIPSRDYNIS